MGINIISVFILLGVLIFVHELGHFLIAKWSGVKVLKFSLGFGPKVIGKSIGETEYLISLIPLGGYVKLLGESDEDDVPPEEEERSFQKQSIGKRIGIVGAGPLFNFLFAVITFSLIYCFGVPTLTSRVGDVQQGMAAYEAGIKKDDVIRFINDREVKNWGDLAEIISKSGGGPLRMTIERGKDIIDIHLTPRVVSTTNIFGEEVETYRIGISASSEIVVEYVNPAKALLMGIEESWAIIKITILSVVKMVQGVVSPKTIGGPILIAQMASAQVEEGIVPFIFFMAILSINLGVLNLLPIPVLDGGHLLFLFIEMVFKRQVNVKWREMAQQVGFYILIAIMLFVFYNDIVKMISE